MHKLKIRIAVIDEPKVAVLPRGAAAASVEIPKDLAAVKAADLLALERAVLCGLVLNPLIREEHNRDIQIRVLPDDGVLAGELPDLPAQIQDHVQPAPRDDLSEAACRYRQV